MKRTMIVYFLACTCVFASEEECARNREIRLSPDAISVTAEYPQPHGQTTVTATTWRTNDELRIRSLTFASQCVTSTIPFQFISDLNRPQLDNIDLTYSLGMRSGESNIYASITVQFGEAQTNATHQYRKRTFCIVGDKLKFILNYKPKDNWYETEFVKMQDKGQPNTQSIAAAPDHLRQLSPEAKKIFDRLNSWNKQECDWIERPETKPRNVMTSGESNAFVPMMKRQLMELGVKIKWNANKQLYEAE